MIYANLCYFYTFAMTNPRFETPEWKASPYRRASTAGGARKFAHTLWWSMPGTKIYPEDSRPSVLVLKMLGERRKRARETGDDNFLWDAKTNSFTEEEMILIAKELQILEAQAAKEYVKFEMNKITEEALQLHLPGSS